ncbi:IPT/TIG domain-containing protein [Longimicrobium sp.]|uniref:IPT/TIG domain-containing protein n=1 Tax=Longimicrobium sp. TaxID=2029185 RepID=UPI002E37702B|nr:IPT/TIG domain-containing protein [Longimicrobium sp.]HEX6038942.1 IPT/TIG domain-containing protein [Longimicrobium sp.]
MIRRPHAHARRFAPPLAAGLLALASCTDPGGPTGGRPPGAAGQLALLACEVRMSPGTLECVDASGVAGAPSAAARGLGHGALVRIVGETGTTSAGAFEASAALQNLANVAVGTKDGTNPHPAGVRVVFVAPPEVTAGAGGVTLASATGADVTDRDRPNIQNGGAAGPDLGADGVLASTETSAARAWRFAVDAGVERFGFVVQVRAETAPGARATVAPQVTGTSAATLVPGQTVTLTGVNFNPAAARNAVRIAGVPAVVTGGGPTSLQVVVPCAAAGAAAVQVEHGGVAGVPVARTLNVPRRALAPGEAVIVTDRREAACNELAPSGGDARYVVAVYSTDADPSSDAGFQLSAGGGPVAGNPHTSAASLAGTLAVQTTDPHLRVMEMNRREHARLRTRFRGDARMRASRSTSSAVAEPPLTRTIRVADVAVGSCDQFYEVSATRVYYDGRIAIYEDDATPAWAKAAANPQMQGYYTALGDEYNAQVDPMIRRAFGDPLLRDGQTDANGILIALFTPLLNSAFGGVPAYVVSCDFFPREDGNSGSNHGEFLYAFQPTVNASGYSGLTPENWYFNLRSGIAHEVKHIASMAARVAADAPLDAPWLEEGTGRHAEELFARNTVYRVAWKANTGYGSASAPGSIYCDFKRTDPACLAAEQARPAVTMYRHFLGLRTFLRAPESVSPFGATPAGGASFYETSWSLVRYAVDRYGASDEQFLRALTASSLTGTENLAAAAGVSLEKLMGGWALSLYADDYPGLRSPSLDTQIPTWNFRDIYAGLNREFPLSFPAPYLLAPRPLTFGAIGAVDVPSVVGGGVAYFEISGPHTRSQLLSLQGLHGGALPSTLRIAIARLQ